MKVGEEQEGLLYVEEYRDGRINHLSGQKLIAEVQSPMFISNLRRP
jgi:hypothetical protein